MFPGSYSSLLAGQAPQPKDLNVKPGASTTEARGVEDAEVLSPCAEAWSLRELPQEDGNQRFPREQTSARTRRLENSTNATGTCVRPVQTKFKHCSSRCPWVITLLCIHPRVMGLPGGGEAAWET